MMEDTRVHKYVKSTALQVQVFAIMNAEKSPLLTAQEIGKLAGKAACQLGAVLAGLHKRGLIRPVKLPVKDFSIIMIPGRFVGQYRAGMVAVIEKKSHWYVKSRIEEVIPAKQERQLAAKKAFADHKRTQEKAIA